MMIKWCTITVCMEILGGIVILLCILHYYVRFGRMGRIVNKLPGPSPWPLLGNISEYPKKYEDIWPTVLKLNQTYGPVYKIWTPTWALVTVLHPNDIEIILSSSKNTEKSFIYTFLNRWLRTGLLTSSGKKWQQRRKMFTPVFHFNILQEFMDIIVEHGEKMVNSIKAENETVALDLQTVFAKYTLSTICETAMGTPIDSSDEATKKIRDAVHDVGEQIVKRFHTLVPIPDWFYYNFMSRGRKEKKSIQILHDFSMKIIQQRKQYHVKKDKKYLKDTQAIENSNEGLYLNSSQGKKRRLAVLDLLITASNDGLIDDEGILEEVNTFIFEGNDTTSAALTYIVQLLAEHVEMQEKAREEVNTIWKSCDGKFTINDINKLVFLERFIKESMRLFPSVPYISRAVTEDIQIRKNNYVIPAGAIIQITINDIHRNEEFWPEPDKFDPDRFLPENSANRHPFSYIPFSAGPRNCIGQKFAMLEIKTFCAYVLRNFRLEALQSCMDFLIKPDLVLRPQKPFRVNFVPLDKNVAPHFNNHI